MNDNNKKTFEDKIIYNSGEKVPAGFYCCCNCEDTVIMEDGAKLKPCDKCGCTYFIKA